MRDIFAEPTPEKRPNRVSIALTNDEFLTLQRLEVAFGGRRIRLGPSLNARILVAEALRELHDDSPQPKQHDEPNQTKRRPRPLPGKRNQPKRQRNL